jgi:beta-lactamase superfamily II metal-dependent hydrolase
VQAAITLQREKALKATSGKFKDVWLVFQGQHGRFFLQAVAIKTAQVSRAEKNGHRFPTPAAQQSIYANDLYLLLTMLQGISDFCA